jgi:hypothetical protein
VKLPGGQRGRAPTLVSGSGNGRLLVGIEQAHVLFPPPPSCFPREPNFAAPDAIHARAFAGKESFAISLGSSAYAPPQAPARRRIEA